MYFYWALFIVIAIASYSAQANLKSKFQKYSKIPTSGGLTGCDVAMQMLHDHGIFDVRVTQIEGQLTDHYDPQKRLSISVKTSIPDVTSLRQPLRHMSAVMLFSMQWLTVR